MVLAGEAVASVARQYGVSRQAIYHKIDKHGLIPGGALSGQSVPSCYHPELIPQDLQLPEDTQALENKELRGGDVSRRGPTRAEIAARKQVSAKALRDHERVLKRLHKAVSKLISSDGYGAGKGQSAANSLKALVDAEMRILEAHREVLAMDLPGRRQDGGSGPQGPASPVIVVPMVASPADYDAMVKRYQQGEVVGVEDVASPAAKPASLAAGLQVEGGAGGQNRRESQNAGRASGFAESAELAAESASEPLSGRLSDASGGPGNGPREPRSRPTQEPAKPASASEGAPTLAELADRARAQLEAEGWPDDE